MSAYTAVCTAISIAIGIRMVVEMLWVLVLIDHYYRPPHTGDHGPIL